MTQPANKDLRTEEEKLRGVMLTVEDYKSRRRALFAEMSEYVEAVKKGANARELKKPNGDRLSYVERDAIYRMLPAAYNTAKHGRVVVNTAEGPVATVYDCPANLAGRLWVCARDGYMTEIPIMSSNAGCNHVHCAAGRPLRKGAAEDTVVMVLPEKAEFYDGQLVSSQGVGTTEEWNSVYHHAIYAVKLMKSVLTIGQQRKFFGYSYLPTSLFAEVVVFVARLYGLKNVGFVSYRRHVELFDGMRSGRTGSSQLFSELMSSVGNSIFESLSVQAWALHDLSALRTVFPSSQIPFRWYLENFDEFKKGFESLVDKVVLSSLLAGGGQARLLGLVKVDYKVLFDKYASVEPLPVPTELQKLVIQQLADGSEYGDARRNGVLKSTMLDIPYSVFRIPLLLRNPLRYSGKLRLPEAVGPPIELLEKDMSVSRKKMLQSSVRHASHLDFGIAPMDVSDGIVAGYLGNEVLKDSLVYDEVDLVTGEPVQKVLSHQ